METNKLPDSTEVVPLIIFHEALVGESYRILGQQE